MSVGAASSAQDCASSGTWSVTLGTTVSAGGSIRYSFVWPTSLATAGSTYAICAEDALGLAGARYEVLSSRPPTLTLSAASAQVGHQVTVTGTSFYGVPALTLTLSSTHGTRLLTSLAPYADGTFVYEYMSTRGDTGTVTIAAVSPSEGGAPPALEARAVLVVVAPGTPVPTITATAVASTATPQRNSTLPVGTTSTWQPSQLWLLVGMPIAGLLVLLGGLVAVLARQSRPVALDSLAQARADPRLTGRFSTSGLTGMTARVPVREGPGAVALWEESSEDELDPEDAGPGPDWHARPMGGTHVRITAIGVDDDPAQYAATEAREVAPDWYEAPTGASGYSASGYSASGYTYEPPSQPAVGPQAANGAGQLTSDLGLTRGR